MEVRLRRTANPVLIHPGLVPELTRVTWDEVGVTLGAAVTLSDIETELLAAQERFPGELTKSGRDVSAALSGDGDNSVRCARPLVSSVP